MTQSPAMDLSFNQDPAWLDREYNNRALVPDHPAYFERWAEASKQARERGGALVDVRYGHGPLEQLDIFPAQGAAGAAPVLFFIHGGYWRALDKADHSFLAPLFQQLGVCVVVANYALAPAITIPGITLQMVQALAWTHRHIAAHGGDPSRITVAGHSAGGHLAAMMLACRWPEVGADLPASLVRNALSISGVFDLEPVRLAPFVQPSLKLTPDQVRKASPARLPSPGLRQGRGALVAVAGGDESGEFRRQNRLIREAWGAEVVPVCEDLPGLNHFSVLDALVTPGHRLHTLARGLLGV
ncbi:alpha/beta hydrolase [Hydrogenophaga intermedia]|uniref:Esterase/lipase n=1 Tax=Hydrogenophaga intermedia TaxID=65786 RepID=A0A1L1PDU4_HYDIT|nr:alpha/beta hydrolase [Hydrogenophaga intermedia]CDN86964.1 Esterase/lipase [Hydrogenophaga intermedia]